MKRRGFLRKREIVPSKGERKYRRRRTLPQLGPVKQWTKVQSNADTSSQLFKSLKERGWAFKCTTEAISPRGFTYSAVGESPSEAFLKAFGMWQREAKQALPAIRGLLMKVANAAAAKAAHAKTEQDIRLDLLPPERAYRKNRVHRIRAANQTEYRRKYMRIYRQWKKLESARRYVGLKGSYEALVPA